MRGFVRAVRWHVRIMFVWGALTRWRDCLVRITLISYVYQTPCRSIGVLIRRRGAGFSAILEKCRIVGRVDGVGARSTRGSWDVAILRQVVEAMIILQRQYLKQKGSDLCTKSAQEGRQYGGHQHRKAESEQRKGRGPSPRGSSQDVRPPIGANYRGSLAAARGSTRGTGSLRSS